MVRQRTSRVVLGAATGLADRLAPRATIARAALPVVGPAASYFDVRRKLCGVRSLHGQCEGERRVRLLVNEQEVDEPPGIALDLLGEPFERLLVGFVVGRDQLLRVLRQLRVLGARSAAKCGEENPAAEANA